MPSWLTLKLGAMIVGILLIVGLVALTLSQCSSSKTASKQAEVSKEQGQASVGAGQEAMNTVSNVAGKDAETDAAVAQGQAEIAAAAKGQKGAAAKRAACRLRTYKDTPQCKEPIR